ncbi:ACP S-malonyltransferase [Streptomyces sp. NPDC051940]|uniref:ACP S-malonyltransferase n=1 Tax=Streptomyces sp. NPDC051940 TaxID=3155675 RepID=UPI0034410A94
MSALVFPGQGTQRAGMGQALFHGFAEAGAVLRLAESETGIGLGAMLRRGPAATLRRTENAQVAVITVDLAALAVLRKARVRYQAVAGHSVGALAALAAAGALTDAQVLWLAARRGRIMGALPGGGAMTSVAGAAADRVRDVVRETARELALPLVVGLVNSASRVVLSGAREAVDLAAERLLEDGAAGAVPLEVSHAFHSPLMAGALPAWRDTVAALPLRDAAVPVVADTTGEPLVQRRQLRDYLVDQLTQPVRWDLVTEGLARLGAGTAVETGDSKVLRLFAGDAARDGEQAQRLRVVSMAQPHVLTRLRAGLAPADVSGGATGTVLEATTGGRA